ncbi:hypothetical protein AALO_G00253430 [Alosa alosa]|uniref:Histone-lysine N-methyltransferase ASH1L n=1 Tax=Alosa alosa TaxID=278164 RepID=A0AAV6FNL0_9TELE|nr:hypothetical protein AALO_G00253430 [Alosa alosa]
MLGPRPRPSPSRTEESGEKDRERGERDGKDGPRDLSKGSSPSGLGKSEAKERERGFVLAARGERGKSSSPAKNSPLRDSRPSRTASPAEPGTRRNTSPSEPSGGSPPPPLSDSAPGSPGSPAEQDNKPLKKRRGRRPRWTRVVNRSQKAAQDAALSQAKPGMPMSALGPNPPPVRRPVGRPPNPNKVQVPPAVPQLFDAPPKKRGRPKSKMPRLDAPARGRPPLKLATSKVFSSFKSKEEQDPPVLHPEVDLNPPKPMPRKRGRPKRLPPTLPQEGQPPTLAPEQGDSGDKTFRSKGNGQLIMKTIIGKINKMKTVKRKRLLSQILLGSGVGPEGESRVAGTSTTNTVAAATQSLSSLAATFGGKLGPQINVSKKGTIYMGKRRGRKPKAAANPPAGAPTPPPEPFLSPNTSSPHHPHPSQSLQSQQHHQLPPTDVFPSPSLSQSSGGQSPISDASFVEPGSVHCTHCSHGHHGHHGFPFAPPTFSAPSPRSLGPMGSGSGLASAASQKKSSCRGYHHHHHHYRTHYHYRKVSPPRPLLPTSPAPLSELKEATPSPVSESHSEETVPSDSGIGTDNNSTSDRGEKAGGAGLGGVGMPQGVASGLLMPGVMGSAVGVGAGLSPRGRKRHASSVLIDRPSPSPSPLGARSSPDPRRAHPAAGPASALVGHKEKHKHKCKRRGHACPAYDKLKRQKRKRKKKYLQLRSRRQDPDFLAELDEICVRLSDIRISHRTPAMRLGSSLALGAAGAGGTGRGATLGSGRSSGGSANPPPHHYLHRDLLPTIFRINFSGYYSPHPAYPCDSLHYVRKPDLKKKRGRPPKLRESMSEVPFVPGLGFPLSSGGFYHPSYSVPYSSAPLGLGYYHVTPSEALYPPHSPPPPPHSSARPPHHSPSFPPPPPPSYMHHHPSHLLLNPSKFHKKKHKLLRQEYLGGGRSPVLYPPMAPELSFGWHHKHKHRHKHRERCGGPDEQLERGGSAERAERAERGERGDGVGLGRGGGGGGGGAGGMEALQHCRFGRDGSAESAGKPTSSSAAASANSPSSSSSSSAERYKRKEASASCLGPSRLALGSRGHTSADSWFRVGTAEADYGKLSHHSAGQPGAFSDGHAAQPIGCSDSEEDEGLSPAEDDAEPPSAQHTNLFASALTRSSIVASGRREARASMGGGGRPWRRLDRSLRKDRSTSAERRETGGMQTRGANPSDCMDAGLLSRHHHLHHHHHHPHHPHHHQHHQQQQQQQLSLHPSLSHPHSTSISGFPSRVANQLQGCWRLPSVSRRGSFLLPVEGQPWRPGSSPPPIGHHHPPKTTCTIANKILHKAAAAVHAGNNMVTGPGESTTLPSPPLPPLHSRWPISSPPWSRGWHASGTERPAGGRGDT